MGQVAAPAPVGTSQRRSLVAALAADSAVNLAGAFGFLGMVDPARDPWSRWEFAALVVWFLGQMATSEWLDRIGRKLERRDMRGLRFGRYGRHVLGRWAWLQAFAWLSTLGVLGLGAFAFANTF